MRYLFILTLYFLNLAGFGQARGNGMHKVLRNQEQQNQRNEQKLRKADRMPGKTNAMDRLSRMKALRTAFMSTSLDLNAEMSRKFLPLYNQYVDELLETRQQKRINLRQNSGSEQLKTDLALDQKLVDIRRHYFTEFAKILPPDKVSQIPVFEQQFQDTMLKEFKENKQSTNN